MIEEEKTQNKKPQKGKESVRLQVTLVQRGPITYDVLDANSKPLLCKCGRPILASLHNASVPKRLEPCSLVVIK